MSISQYKTSKGQTRYRVRYTRPDGTRTDKRGFTTKTAARQWEARTITGDVTLGNKHEPTINDLTDHYRASLASLAPGTAAGYTTALEGHVLPRWGRTKPSEITRNPPRSPAPPSNSGSQAKASPTPSPDATSPSSPASSPSTATAPTPPERSPNPARTSATTSTCPTPNYNSSPSTPPTPASSTHSDSPASAGENAPAPA